ncbi:MAG TPA: tetratricopeptide repeat protein, partial [Patescibacteria group bacterium]|nr:tetratricopeptide repeat protein [Patescibacteria group bacterium]
MKRTFFTTFLLAASAYYAIAQETPSSLSAQAWKAWQSNDLRQAETKFKEALAQQQEYTPAEMGLYYLYLAQKNNSAANKHLANMLRYEKNYQPYVFAALHTPYGLALEGDKAGRDVLETLLSRDNAGTVLKAVANEYLGLSRLRRGDIVGAEKHFAEMNAITDWKIVGPFDNVSASGIEKVFPPEGEFQSNAEYKGRNGIPAPWITPAAMRRDRWVDFERYYYIEDGVAYANTFVYSPQKQKVHMRIGTSGAIRAFLNDELFLEDLEEKNNDLDTYVTEAELQQGWNRVLLKLGASEIERCNFMVRITDANGEQMDGLKISTDPQNYASKPGARFKNVDHFAEEFFKNKISENPQEPLNYLLLTDVYHHNDKSLESELLLRQAAKYFPEAEFINKAMLTSHLRAKKYDEYNTLLERIYTLNNNDYDALNVKYSRAIENEQYDEAEEFLAKMSAQLPNSPDVLMMQINLAAKKNQIEKMNELIDRAYAKFPRNASFVYMKMLTTMQKTQNYDEPLKMLSDHVKDDYTVDNLVRLAAVYYQAKRIEDWDKTYQKIFELDPAVCGYYSQYGQSLMSSQNYEKAEKAFLKAIEISPSASNFHLSLGNLYRETSRTDKAIAAYHTALKYGPTNFSAREALRDISGKKNIFSQFQTVNIDSILKNAPPSSDYPG